MSTRSNFLLLGIVGLLLAALPVWANPGSFIPPEAVIENSGSTNNLGYKVGVSLNGDVWYSREKETDIGNTEIPGRQARTLFRHLAAAMPLSKLPVHHGMRSTSFGTRMTIEYEGQTSPDLTSASDSRSRALKADIDGITKGLHLGNLSRHPVIRH